MIPYATEEELKQLIQKVQKFWCLQTTVVNWSQSLKFPKEITAY